MRTFYVDMDGVLANLYDYLTLRMVNKQYTDTTEQERECIKSVFKNKEKFVQFFPEGPEAVFESLDPFPFNKALIEWVVQQGGEYTILSRPSSLDLVGTSNAKRKWVETHLSFCPPKEVLLVQDKTANNRSLGNVLIDDYDPFLAKWSEKGGYSIKYRAWEFSTEEEVVKYMTRAASFSYK